MSYFILYFFCECPEHCYVTDFLNRKTGFIRGAEGFARKYDIPVLYYEVVKERKISH